MDLGVGVPDHHDAVADAQPREHRLLGFGAGLADLVELEHAHEVVERGALVFVGQAGIDVGHGQHGHRMLARRVDR